MAMWNRQVWDGWMKKYVQRQKHKTTIDSIIGEEQWANEHRSTPYCFFIDQNFPSTDRDDYELSESKNVNMVATWQIVWDWETRILRNRSQANVLELELRKWRRKNPYVPLYTSALHVIGCEPPQRRYRRFYYVGNSYWLRSSFSPSGSHPERILTIVQNKMFRTFLYLHFSIHCSYLKTYLQVCTPSTIMHIHSLMAYAWPSICKHVPAQNHVSKSTNYTRQPHIL